MRKAISRLQLFLLAVVMIITIIPATAISVKAADLSVSVSGLRVQYSTSNYTSCKGSGNEIVATASGYKAAYVISRSSSIDITFTNSREESAELSFSYTLVNGGDVKANTGTLANGTYHGTLDSGKSVKITLTSPKGADTNTLNINGITLIVKKNVTTTFLPAINGSYTVNGEAVTAECQKTQESTVDYVLEAIPSAGYKFMGWYNHTVGSFIGSEKSVKLKFDEDPKLEPKFILSDTPIFGVSGMKFTDLKEADDYARNNGVKEIVLLDNGTLTGQYTISKGNVLIIPMDDTGKYFTTTPESVGQTSDLLPQPNKYVTPSPYRTLKMASESSIIVNGAISVNARHAQAAGSKTYGSAPSGPCGMIEMASGSDIVVNNGGSLYAWGYIIGDGTVTGKSGSSIYEYFQLGEFRGGSVTTEMVGNKERVFPLSQYYVQNVEVEEVLESGSKVSVYLSVFMSYTEFNATVPFIGEGGMFNPESGASVTKTYIPSEDRLQVDVSGNVELSGFNMSIAGNDVNSKDYVLPINSNITINIHSGEATISQDVALLPGVEVNVAKGATLNIGSNVYIYDEDDWGNYAYGTAATKLSPIVYSPTKSKTRTESDLIDAVVDVNGTVNVSGAAYTTIGGAKVISSKGTGMIQVSSVEELQDKTYQFDQSDYHEIPITPIKLYNGENELGEDDFTLTDDAVEAGGSYYWNADARRWMKVTNPDNQYYVKWVSEDGQTVLKDKYVEYGEVAAEFDGETPTKESTPEYSYEFSGWVTTYEDDGNVTHTASYKEVPNEYTITFNMDGGEEIAPITQGYGTEIDLTVSPTKTGYTFAGWDKDIPATMPAENITLTAKWTINQYTITFDTDGGNEIASITQDYGTAVTAPADPTKTGYTFARWDVAIPETMPAENMTITAEWVINKYEISWDTDGDGKADDKTSVKYNEMPSHADPSKVADAQYTYTFAGWTPELKPATENITYTAQFNSTVNKYKISWDTDGDGTVDDTTEVAYGDMPSHADGSKSSDGMYIYTFAGWSSKLTAVTQDTLYTATFDSVPVEYTITFDSDGGSAVDAITAGYGTAIEKPADPVKTGYTFAGWDKEIPATMPVGNITITAKWTINQYTITFDTDGGNEIASITQDYGTAVTAPADPTKTGYTFAGWDKEIPTTMPAENVTITAKWTINKYTITWKNYDGNVLYEEELEYGKTPSYSGEEPTCPDNSQYTYTFKGWTPEIKPVTGDETYQAEFTPVTREYLIKWVDDNGSELYFENVKYGDMPVYKGTAPAKEATAQYTYTFAGWSPEVVAVEGEETYTAKYDAIVNTYTVTWKNEGGVLLEEDKDVKYGDKPSYDGATPVKEATAQYSYEFAGWDKKVEEVTGDVVYTATYTEVVNKYTIGWDTDGDGTVDAETTVAYGLKPYYTDGSKEADAQYTYTFTGWSPEVVEVTEPTVYTAQFSKTINSYTVTWFDEDGITKLDEQTIVYGTKPVYEGSEPTKTATAQYTYTFAGWTPEITNDTIVTGNMTFKAVYSATVNEYTVTWKNDATVLDEQKVAYGTKPVYTGQTPEKAANEQYTYVFSGWSPEVTDVTGDITYLATFEAVEKGKGTIIFDTAGGNLIAPITQYIGTEVIAPDDPVRTGYTFAGWDQEIPEVMPDSNMTITAKWNVNQYNIKFNLDGGTAADGTLDITDITQDYGTTVEKPADPIKVGYTFAGWDVKIPDSMPAENLVITAKWTINQYTIKFNLTGGTTVDGATEIADITQDYGTAVEKPADPVKTGYTFLGWEPEVPEVMPAENCEIRAKWNINLYSIEFDVDGDGEADETITQGYGTQVTAPENPTKEGYTFIGWDQNVPSTMPLGGMKLTAQWEVAQFKITFDLDGGTTADGTVIAPIIQDYGTTVAAPADPVKTGYTFEGWDTEIPTTMPAENMTITAKWKVNQYTITFNTDGGTVIDSITQDYGTAITKPANPTKTGYVFDGWDTKVPTTMPAENMTITANWVINQYTITFNTDGGNVINKITQNYGTAVTVPADPVKTGYTFAGWDKEIPTTMPAENMTITANWTINQYTITFDTGEGTPVAPIVQDYAASITKPAEPTRTGYTFAGWDKDIPETMPAGNMVITAKWTVNQYTIAFVTNGGTDIDNIIQDYNTEVTAPADPTRTGYTFAGWDKEIPATMPAENITITANWTINQYTITFDTGEGTPVAPIVQDYASPIAKPAEPTRTGYTFAGWDVAIPETMPAENMTITAEWVINEYEISWDTDGDGKADDTTSVKYNEMPSHKEPVKEADAQYTYTFAGWSPELKPATDNITYTALFNTTVNMYEIGWDTDGNGTVDDTTEVAYGDMPSYADGSKTSDEKYSYKFTGWSPELSKVTGDAVYTAAFDSIPVEYTITFDSDGGTAIEQITAGYGAEIKKPADPIKTGHTFAGWDVDIPDTMPVGNMTITAKWTVNQYTIAFDTVGGSEVSNITQDYGTAIVAPADPAKTGYTFAGWTPAIPATMPAENLDITANWTINQYTITFNTDGGTDIAPITQDYGTAITKPADPVKEGYTFAGWDIAIPTEIPAENITITAKWTANSYKITFITDDVNNPYAEAIQDFGEEIKLPEEPKKEGYIFGGWVMNVEENNQIIEVQMPTAVPAKDIVVFAKWNITENTIFFNTDGGTEIAPIVQNYGTEVIAPADPTKTGYTFLGWEPAVPATMPAENITIKAQWKINQYTISFDTDGGSAINAITQDYATAVAMPANPEKAGYTFAGWNTDIPAAMPAENITIKALWTVNEYTISFNTNGGSAIDSITADYGTVVTAPADPTKTGYTFVGWDAAFPETMPAGGLTLNALWSANEYVIHWDTDGDGTVDDSTMVAYDAMPSHADGTKAKTAEYTYRFTGWSPALTTVTGSTTYVAQFEALPNPYKITYNTDGGSRINAAEYSYGLNIEVPEAPTKEGYTFVGWNPEIPATMPAENITVTAQWKVNEYTLTFDTVGGSTVDSITAGYGSAISEPVAPTKEGYTFIGWSPELPTNMPAEDVVYTAQWKVNEYLLTFDTDGGNVITPLALEYGAEVEVPEMPVKAGYQFIGWNAEIPVTMPARDLTITALWKVEKYTLTFDTDGGSAVDPITADFGSEIIEPAAPVKEGYVFDGWNPEFPETMPSEDMTLQAVWKLDQYTLTFDTDGGNEIPPMILEYGAEIEVPEMPVKEGYKFVGWDMEIPVTMPARDMTITAIWEAAGDIQITEYVWMQPDGNVYVRDEEGTRVTTPSTPVIGGNKYYIGADGYLMSGWLYLGDWKMYFSPVDYTAAVSFNEINGKMYLFNDDGVMQNFPGTTIIHGKKYWFSTDDASLKTGWLYLNNMKLYFDPETYEAAIGFKEIDGKMYLFNEDGVMQDYAGTTIVNGKKYWFSDDNASLKTGWLNLGDWKLYFDPETYEAAVGFKEIDGKMYLFNEDGVMQTYAGTTIVNGKKYWFSDGDASLKTGWLNLGDWKLYFDPETYAAVVGTVEIDGQLYLFDENGILLQTLS